LFQVIYFFVYFNFFSHSSARSKSLFFYYLTLKKRKNIHE
jgi:hypothetical protein